MADIGFEIAPLPHIAEYRPEDAEALARCWHESSLAWPGGGLATAASVATALTEWDTLTMFLAWAPDLDPGASAELVGYLVVADDLEQARLYQALGEQEGLF